MKTKHLHFCRDSTTMPVARNRTHAKRREFTTSTAVQTAQTKGISRMNTRRHNVVRFAASAIVAAAITLGAHAFVPAAYGCGSAGAGNCRTTTEQTNDAWSFLNQARLIVDALDVLLP